MTPWCQQRPRLFISESLLCQPNAIGFSFSLFASWSQDGYHISGHHTLTLHSKAKNRVRKKVCFYQEDTVPPKLPSRLLFHWQEFKHMTTLSFKSKLASDKGWCDYILGLVRSLFISSDWIHWCFKKIRGSVSTEKEKWLFSQQLTVSVRDMTLCAHD